MPEAGVFLDRDGTINVRAPEHEYIGSAEQFEWLPGALEGMVRLARAGLPLIVVSNQRGVSRGMVTLAGIGAIERVIQDALARKGVRVTAFRYCTHGLNEQCDCRKPRPGMLTAAAREFGLDLSKCWMIGDADEDVAAGRAAGCAVIRIADTAGGDVPTAPSLLDAAKLVLAYRPVLSER
jgi:D-glycero-D-manno-heptose 1,7-bisphosphate phosphatase